jgi:cell shape-determining protein MreD
MSLSLFLIIILSFLIVDFRKVFMIAFLTGFLSDLILGNLVGFTSLIFLTICFLIYLYRKKFSSSHFLFQLIFIVLADGLFTWVKGEIWSFKGTLVLVLMSLPLFFFMKRIKGKRGLELLINS